MIRDDSAQTIAYGRNNVLACLEAGIVIKLLVQDNFDDEKILNLAKAQNLQILTLRKKELNDLSGGNHQGVTAYVKVFNYVLLEQIIAKADQSEHPLILMLDEIKDPHNLGAIIRSAEAFGVSGIIMKKDRQVAITPTVMKVATGAQNNILIAQVTNLNQAISKLKKANYWVVSTDLTATQSVSSLKYDFKTVVIVGNEHKGVSPLLTKSSDYIVKIPMLGKTNSLNVSVATGVILAMIRQIQL